MEEIFNGFINTLFKDEYIEKSAKDKLLHCFSCELRSGSFCSKKKQSNGVKGCGCLLSIKSRSNSKCPMGKWQ